MAEEVYCYNPGCQQKFDPSKNTEDSCVYHPGPHFFHDAYKGWECCNKRVTDFTEFLNIKGCANGLHNPNKPPEPEKPKKSATDSENNGLTAALEKKAQEKLEQAQISEQDSEQTENRAAGASVKPGTSCERSGCKASFVDDSSLEEECKYHPGVAIFHETVKYWTCCKKKTMEFDDFMDQVGCTVGKHAWTREAAGKAQTACKYDWHQTGSFVTVAIYAKGTLPDLSVVEVNRVHLRAHIEFDYGKSRFDLDVPLWGAISVENSSVSATPNKVEIKMKKADPVKWPTLDYKQKI